MFNRFRNAFKPAANVSQAVNGRASYKKAPRDAAAKPPPTIAATAKPEESGFKLTPTKLFRGAFILVGTGIFLSRVLLNPDDPNSLINRALNPNTRAKYVLKIEKMDDTITGYQNTFIVASKGLRSALKNQSRYALGKQIGIELESISDDQMKLLQESAKSYRIVLKQYKEQLEKIKESQLELLTSIVKDEKLAVVLKAKTEQKQKEGGEEKKSTTEVVHDKIAHSITELEEKLQKLLVETVAGQSRAELDFIKQIDRILSTEQRSKVLIQDSPAILSRLKNALLGLDSSKSDVLLESIGKASVLPSYDKRKVFVLTFTGDVMASQVKKLREEITAILQICDAKRGDEVVINLNSGGGTVTGYGLGAAQLDRIKQAGLTLTVCIDEVAASGGYLMASVADKIIASPFAVLGSVGVIATIPNVSERLQREGIMVEDVTAGKFKRTLTPYKKATDEDRKKMKEDVESILVLFKNYLKEHRPSLKVDLIATGETWHGPQALEKGLIDSVDTSDDLLLQKRRAGADVYYVSLKPITPRFGDSFEDDQHASSSSSMLGSIWQSMKASMGAWIVGLIQSTIHQTLGTSMYGVGDQNTLSSSSYRMSAEEDGTTAWQQRVIAMDIARQQYPPKM